MSGPGTVVRSILLSEAKRISSFEFVRLSVSVPVTVICVGVKVAQESCGQQRTIEQPGQIDWSKMYGD